jgi:UDP-glucose 4-epimerase
VGRRVLVTGLSTFWGGKVAQALEADPTVDVIIGLDTEEPRMELQRTEYVRADQSYSILARLVKATQVDTILHTFLVVDSARASGRALHEINVIGTMNLLAAAGAPDSSVRHIVVKSSTLVYGSGPKDPYEFAEDASRTEPVRTRVERSLLEVEGYLEDFAEDNPHVTVTLLRFSNVLGPDIVTSTSRLLDLPFVPAVTGFDPQLEFVEESDVIRSILHVMEHEIPGIFNVTGDGRLPWSECASLCGKRAIPFFPPYGAELVMGPLARVWEVPPELLQLLRYGRGSDNSRLKQAGFRYRYTSAGTVRAYAEAANLRRAVKGESEYQYETDVENFFRHSPAVVNREGV